MLDGSNRSWADSFWHMLARPLAAAGLSPNQITWAGLFLVVGNCVFYASHQQSFWLGLGLALSFAFDALDGAVARMTGKTSKYGGYLDAVVDRQVDVLRDDRQRLRRLGAGRLFGHRHLHRRADVGRQFGRGLDDE